MRDENGNFHMDIELATAGLNPFAPSCGGGARGAMFTGQFPMTQQNPPSTVVMDPNDPNPLGTTPAAIESSSAMLAEKHKIENWSDKRLVQTSPPYPSMFEALDACAANRSLENCEYAYVTDDRRVVGIYSYYDVTPDQPVQKGQKRVIIPMEQKANVSYVQVAKVAQASGLSWSTADDLGNVIKRVKNAHPDAVIHAETVYAGASGARTRQLNLSIIMKD
jgi:hypothetical protein